MADKRLPLICPFLTRSTTGQFMIKLAAIFVAASSALTPRGGKGFDLTGLHSDQIAS